MIEKYFMMKISKTQILRSKFDGLNHVKFKDFWVGEDTAYKPIKNFLASHVVSRLGSGESVLGSGHYVNMICVNYGQKYSGRTVVKLCSILCLPQHDYRPH